MRPVIIAAAGIAGLVLVWGVLAVEVSFLRWRRDQKQAQARQRARDETRTRCSTESTTSTGSSAKARDAMDADAGSRAGLDAETDQAVMIFRHNMPLSPLQEIAAAALADAVALQFGHVPEAGRILVRLAQQISPAGEFCGHMTAMIAVLGAAGARLAEQEADGG